MLRRTILFACTMSRIVHITRCLSIASPASLKTTSLSYSFVPLNLNKNMSSKPVTKSVKYEEVVAATREPETYIIDVREPDELRETGVIPSSLNVPLGEVENALKILSSDAFKQKYGRDKPMKQSRIIFSCRSGKRATTAADLALKSGFINSEIYKGSWLDWASHIGKN